MDLIDQLNASNTYTANQPIGNISLTMDDIGQYIGTALDDKETELLTKAVQQQPLSQKQIDWVRRIEYKLANVKTCPQCSQAAYPLWSLKQQKWFCICKNTDKHKDNKDVWIKMPESK